MEKNGSKKSNFNSTSLFIVISLINIYIILILLIKQKNYNEEINHINIKNLKITNNINEIRKSEQKLNEITEYHKVKIREMFKLFSINKIPYDNFNEQINKKYIQELNYFCDNQELFSNQDYEKEIQISNISLNNKEFNIYVYKKSDFVSNKIIKDKSWESIDTNKIIYALNYYKNKTKIDNEKIYILDIGANIGWYSVFLGKYGYKIISFEASEKNSYILKKNYCLNRDIKITIINKGLYNNEEECEYYEVLGNIGDGLVICEENQTIPNGFKMKGTISLTKLSNYISYFSDKNLTLMKIDVEGAEESVILSGVKLITEYHIPFIFMEYNLGCLNLHNVDILKFLKLFEDNGYKISISNFLDKNYISIKDLVKSKKLFNLYLTYNKILE
jgi:FkbM family methyltransferase